MGFLDPLNGLMVAGSMLADDYIDDSEIDGADVLNASSDAIYQSIIDLPAMSSLADLINGYKYSTGNSAIEKGFDAATEYAAGQAPSFIVPNFIGGIAQGADNTVRDTYSSGSTAQQAADNIKSKIPGLRETLPARLDNFGREQTYTNNPLLNALNANVLPGQITPYTRYAVSDELSRLGDAGFKGMFPSVSSKSTKITKNKSLGDLTGAERKMFDTAKGQTSYSLIQSLIGTSKYQKMDDSDKAKAVNDVYEYATGKAKLAVDPSAKVDNWIARAAKLNDPLPKIIGSHK